MLQWAKRMLQWAKRNLKKGEDKGRGPVPKGKACVHAPVLTGGGRGGGVAVVQHEELAVVLPGGDAGVHVQQQHPPPPRPAWRPAVSPGRGPEPTTPGVGSGFSLSPKVTGSGRFS